VTAPRPVPLLAGLCLAFAGTAAAQRPNVVLIMADDLGWGDLGAYGQERVRTPQLDRMAAEGLRFTAHYAGSTVCAPSRAVLMTGLHTGHAAVRGNQELQPLGQYPLPAAEVTLAEVLRSAGYRTHAIGKWGLGPPGSDGDPLAQGFEHFYGYNCQRNAHFHYPEFLWRDGEKEALEGAYAHDRMAEEALAFVRAQDGSQPFFLYLPFTIPHAGLEVPADGLAEYRGAFAETPWPERHYRGQAEPRAAFAAMVSRLDRDVGRLLAALRESGLDANTLVLFTSDNGPHAEGGADPGFFRSSGPFRGIKRDLYEGGIRVPLIAWWPGAVRPGVTDQLAAFQDYLPTFAVLAGTRAPAGLDGISFAPILKGSGAQARHRDLYWEFHERGGSQAIRAGKWKGVRLQVRRDADAPLELYDLEADPGETTDVAAEHPGVVARLRARIDAEHTPAADWPLLPAEIALR